MLQHFNVASRLKKHSFYWRCYELWWLNIYVSYIGQKYISNVIRQTKVAMTNFKYNRIENKTTSSVILNTFRIKIMNIPVKFTYALKQNMQLI